LRTLSKDVLVVCIGVLSRHRKLLYPTLRHARACVRARACYSLVLYGSSMSQPKVGQEASWVKKTSYGLALVAAHLLPAAEHEQKSAGQFCGPKCNFLTRRNKRW